MPKDMMPAKNRSAGVTAAATLAVLGSVIAFFLWGWLFLPLMNLPPDSNGQHAYQVHPITFALIALVPPFLVALGMRTASASSSFDRGPGRLRFGGLRSPWRSA